MRRANLLCLAAAGLAAQTHTFRLGAPAEVVADLEMRSPGSDWGEAGREAAVALVTLDGAARQHVVLFTGQERHLYPVFLGNLAAGEHNLTIVRDAALSAPPSGLEVAAARIREHRPGDPLYAAVAHAPVVYARPDTVGRFSDVPLLVYCERLEEKGQPLLSYTVVFSNEDGGTSTRALMARWGRTTDIEYVYKAYLGPGGKAARATIQTRDHKEVEFRGRREGAHPLLYVVTRNNMVAPRGRSPVRYQLAPTLIDLAGRAREQVMDESPFCYRVMAQELKREGKLRPFGAVDGEKISDPRNYLYLEAKVENHHSALAVLVRLHGETLWRSSNLGRLDYAMARSGSVCTTIELPPGTKASQVAGLGFQCLLWPAQKEGRQIWPDDGLCRLETAPRAFLLDGEHRPGPVVGVFDEAPVEVPAGQVLVWGPK